MKPEVSGRICIASVLRIFAVVLVTSITICAQERSQYDHGTPPQHAAGVSAVGSYLSTDLGSVNLSNGSLNIKLPTGSVGGRGFWLPIFLNYSNKIWSGSLSGDVDFDAGGAGKRYPVAYAVYDDPDAGQDLYQRIAAGWTIGAVPTLRVRGNGWNSMHNNSNGCTDYNNVLVKLTLSLPDKGEIEFRDDATDGEISSGYADSQGCLTMSAARGRRWHATDGSGTIFISDADDGVVHGDLNGIVITGDGTRYVFTNSIPPGTPSAYLRGLARAVSVTDRNGNTLNVGYPSSTEVQYTDELGRITRIDFGVADPDNGQLLAVLVTLPGYGGQNRYYKVKADTMNLHYRAGINPTLPVMSGDYDPKGYGYGYPGPHTSLFPLSYGSGAERIDNQSVVTQFVLPDGRSLDFNYNEFGEVAEVVLPTGGKIQYDYAHTATLPSGNSAVWEVKTLPRIATDVRDIDRGVVARRTYSDSSTLESSWTYSYYATSNSDGSATNGYTEVQARAADNTLVLNQRHYFLDASRFLNQVSGQVIGTGYSLWSTGTERRTETRDAANAVLMASDQDWSQRAPVSWTYYPNQQIANDNRVNEERKILDDNSVARTHTYYQANVHYNNPIEVQEFDFDDSLKRRTVTSYVDSSTLINGFDYTSDSIHLLSLPLAQTVYDGNGNQVAQSTNEYDVYGSDGNHPPMQDYPTNPTVTGHDSNYGPGKITRGNLTATGHWLKSTGGTIYSYVGYDILGNPVSNRDARGNVTTLSYADDFGDGSNPGGGGSGASGPTYSLLTLITSPPPQPGQPQQTARSQYDFSTGLLTGFKDRNGVTAQTIYNDPFDRPTQVKTALGTSVESHAVMYYAPATNPFGITLSNNDVLTAKDQTSLDDSVLRSWTHTDGFGRTVQTWSRDPQGDDEVITVYDALGRVNQVSNPFRSGETPVYTTTVYDFAGRVTSVATSDNAAVATLYSGSTVTVTDQAGRKRRSVTDGLGRLVRVDEPDKDNGNLDDVNGAPVQPTNYEYDTLDNLTHVYQGSQTRTFVYDSLKRLTSATNPESGAVSYQYDENGNLLHKTDARSITTNYAYDALNRVISRGYSDSTPAVTYAYDTPGIPYSTGRLTSVSSNVSTTTYAEFDALGRIKVSSQKTDSGGSAILGNRTYTMNYGYNLAGALTSEIYPSGRIVKTEFDSAGRVAGLKSQASGLYYAGGASSDNANRIQYAAQGTIAMMKLGNGLWEHANLNARLQTTEIGLGTTQGAVDRLKVNYDYGTTNNNGNLLSQAITVPTIGSATGFATTQNYGYDQLNRLTSAQESGNSWTQNFTYDRFGNRNFVSGTTLPAQLTASNNPVIDPTNNQIKSSASGQTNVTYDPAGNLTRDVDNHTFTYDGENKQTAFEDGVIQNGGATYSYDGGGNRVKKVTINGTSLFVYDATGQMVAEYSDGVQPSTVGTSYLTEDSLGTPRVITDSNGNVKARHDYAPFGEELYAGTGSRSDTNRYVVDNVNQKFTLKERDNETGLDYFIARYYSSAQGRFTSSDDFVKDSHVSDPQSWNKYAYVRNNPLHYVDRDGQKADVDITIDEKRKVGVITVKASFALWTSKDSHMSAKDLAKAKANFAAQIKKGWNGNYQKDGITYNVNVQVKITVAKDQTAAMKSGAQNVIEVTNGEVGDGADSVTNAGQSGNGPDTGRWNNNSTFIAHEFGHLLGVDDRTSGPELMNTKNMSPLQKANDNDFSWTFGAEAAGHRANDFRINHNPFSISNVIYTSNRELHAAKPGEWWR